MLGNNKSIKKHLCFLGFIITAFFIIIGSIGFFVANNLKNNFSMLYNHNLIYEQYLSDINTHMQIIETDASYLLLQKTDTFDADILQKDILQRSEVIAVDIDKLKKITANQQTIAALNTAAANLNLFKNSLAAIPQTSSATDKVKLFETLSIINNLSDNFSSLSANNVIDSKTLFSTNIDNYNFYIKIFSSILFIAALSILGILYFIAHKILTLFTTLIISLQQLQQKNFISLSKKDYSPNFHEGNIILNLIGTITSDFRIFFYNTEQFIEQNTLIITALETLIHNCDIANKSIASTNEENNAVNEKILAQIIDIKNTHSNIKQKLIYSVNDAENAAQYTQKINTLALNTKKTLHISINNILDTIAKNKISLQKYDYPKLTTLAVKINQCITQLNLHVLNIAIDINCHNNAKISLTLIDEILNISQQVKDISSKITSISQQSTLMTAKTADKNSAILNFLNTIVIDDYKNLIAISDKYMKNTDYLNNFSSQNNITTMQIVDSIELNKEILTALNELSNQTNTNNKYITTKSLNINALLHDISMQLNNYQQVSEQLQKKLNDLQY